MVNLYYCRERGRGYRFHASIPRHRAERSAVILAVNGAAHPLTCWTHKPAILAALACPAADLVQAHPDYVQDLAVFAEEHRQ